MSFDAWWAGLTDEQRAAASAPKPHPGPGVHAECGGWAAHRDAPPGESLVGWFKSKNKAHRALDPWRPKPDPALQALFGVMAYATAAFLAGRQP